MLTLLGHDLSDLGDGFPGLELAVALDSVDWLELA